MDISILGNLPVGYDKPNIGWSLFLGIIFQIFSSGNYLDYMAIQRICAVIFSVFTAIPIYFLAEKFFKKEIAMVGVCFFVFSPYVIENSVLGLTDPLFIFLVISFLALIFSKKKINIVFSFIVLGFSTFVRYESVILIIPSVIIFLFKYKQEFNIQKYILVGLVLFLLVVTSTSIWKNELGMEHGITSQLSSGASTVVNENSFNSETKDRFDVFRGIFNFLKYFGASLLPLCFIFIPYSIVSLLKKQNSDFRYLVWFGVVASVPAFYAYGRGFEEVRYMFFIFPVLIISALFLIEKLDLKMKRKNLIPIILMVLIISSSAIYVDFRQPNNEYEIEAIQVAKFVSNLPGKINDYGPESYYVEVMDLEDYELPILSSEIQFKKRVVNVSGETIEDILKNYKDKQISYLGITEQSMKNNQVLKEIFYEEKYTFFNKIYDSKDDLKEFNIKIFEINYERVQ
tara:strand:+ start:2979 stop:4349 length:1371 start_codon:yes stop_codon:yes gene_type:complete